MKRKLLLGLGLLLSSTFVKAQWTNNTSWNYSFGTAPTTTFNTVGTNSSSTPTTANFLPSPPSGTVGVYLNASAASGGFTLNANNTLTQKLPTASFVRFSANSVSAATDVVLHTFKIKFSPAVTTTDGGSYIYAIGNHKGNLFNVTSNNSVFKNSNEIFTALRWTPVTTANSTAIKFEYRVGSDANTTQTYSVIDQTTFAKGTEYTVDIYCNNSAIDQTYTVSTTAYTIHSNTLQIWVNGSILGTDYPRSIEVNGTTGLTSGTSVAIANGVALNSFLFNANGAAAATGSITLTAPKLTYLVAPLPVSLKTFTGKKATNGVELNWQTVSELNNDYFEVLRSENGKDYTSLGVIKGNGTTQQLHSYSYIDVNPISGTNYYQLKQVDNNGTAKIVGETLAVNYSNNLSEFKVATDGNALKIFSFVNKAGLTDFVITDLQGKKVAQSSRLLVKGYNSFSIDVSSLKTGVFVAQMRNENEFKITKFIKE